MEQIELMELLDNLIEVEKDITLAQYEGREIDELVEKSNLFGDKITVEINRLYEMEQTSKNLMVEINLLCELLTLKNCEIADLQQTLNERD